ncbi:MAG TPA: leucine-rich repeat domain-containing protein, partial [Candidatus Angelobacter sp.]|nr:leucine-rich repeat domain-containing protein [Candidatus Angelobacter sp.]
MPEERNAKGWQEALVRIEVARQFQTSSLDLHSLSLTAVPDSFAELTHLLQLDLSGNQLTTIPDSFAHLRQLWRLNLSNN